MRGIGVKQTKLEQLGDMIAIFVLVGFPMCAMYLIAKQEVARESVSRGIDNKQIK